MRTRLPVLLSALLLGLLAAPAAAQSGDATVYVVHGVPDTPVDVYVGGELALDDFQPGTITDALTLPAGSTELAVRPADAAADADPLLEATADLPPGGNVSVVAHLDGSGQPALTPFTNDVSGPSAGQGRLTARHAAAAPEVDVLVGGEPALTGLAPGNEASATLPAGTVSAAVAAAGSTDPLLGPADVTVEAGSQTVGYAIGSADEGTLELLVQTIPGQAEAPSGVGAGDGGAAASPALPTWVIAASVLAGLVALLSVGRLLRRA